MSVPACFKNVSEVTHIHFQCVKPIKRNARNTQRERNEVLRFLVRFIRKQEDLVDILRRRHLEVALLRHPSVLCLVLEIDRKHGQVPLVQMHPAHRLDPPDILILLRSGKDDARPREWTRNTGRLAANRHLRRRHGSVPPVFGLDDGDDLVRQDEPILPLPLEREGGDRTISQLDLFVTQLVTVVDLDSDDAMAGQAIHPGDFSLVASINVQKKDLISEPRFSTSDMRDVHDRVRFVVEVNLELRRRAVLERMNGP